MKAIVATPKKLFGFGKLCQSLTRKLFQVSYSLEQVMDICNFFEMIIYTILIKIRRKLNRNWRICRKTNQNTKTIWSKGFVVSSTAVLVIS